MNSLNPRQIVTVGGANGERVLTVDPAHFHLGSKHTLAPQKVIAGGSSVNHSCRLLATGHSVFPILPIADDEIGRIIVRTLADSIRDGAALPDAATLFMAGDELTTPFTTILNVGTQRTILTEFSDRLLHAYPEHCHAQIDWILASTAGATATPVAAVLIGHVHADREPPGQSGGISQRLLDAFAARGVPVFTNFGSSQFRQGTSRWRAHLKHVACFQLDVDEVRTFLSDAPDLAAPATLEDALAWFRERCTVVVTAERMGAVAQLRGSDHVVLAWPFDLQRREILDTTGAGDAFAAGVVASALETPLESDEALCTALANGRLWGAYACTTLGGASSCPGRTELATFQERHRLFQETDCKPLAEARPMLRLFDRIFLH